MKMETEINLEQNRLSLKMRRKIQELWLSGKPEDASRFLKDLVRYYATPDRPPYAPKNFHLNNLGDAHASKSLCQCHRFK